jgi:hypothetical protein
MCICIYVRYSMKRDKPIYTEHGMLIPWDQKEILERSKSKKIVFSSSPGEGGYCSVVWFVVYLMMLCHDLKLYRFE